ncbi:MAG: ATP-grasp domain-containing protein [Pseudomonadota bacterium]|nr:ATP-grasp domain-containing protein [Pseudomonadota bacterium]
MHVLILGARAPACLEWARICCAAGCKVSVADALAFPITRFSAAVHRYWRLPAPRTRPQEWIAALSKLVTELEIDLVLPTCEEVFYLSHGKQHIPADVFVPSFDWLHRLHHKGTFAHFVQNQGWPITAPETHLLHSHAETLDFCQQHHTQDWVFKPAYSRFASQTLVRPQADTVVQLQPTPNQPWLAQRFIQGREHCSYSLLAKGQVAAHTCYHPRYRVGQGAGIWFEPTSPPAILDFVQRLGRLSGMTGQIAFDFIESVDGRFYVLECNPRATSGIHLLGHEPEKLVDALQGRSSLMHSFSEPSAPPCQVALAMLLFAATKHGLHRSFWRDFCAARDIIFRRDDAVPWVAQGLGVLEVLVRAATQRCGLLPATTTDIQWDGQALDVLHATDRP